jgi:hypothetical protein
MYHNLSLITKKSLLKKIISINLNRILFCQVTIVQEKNNNLQKLIWINAKTTLMKKKKKKYKLKKEATLLCILGILLIKILSGTTV